MKYKNIILLVILLISTLPMQAQEDIKVDFEDPGLEQSIREAIDKPSSDIYASELKGLKVLDAVRYNIKSLKGIEQCTSLEYLYLNGNQISDLSPLAGLTSLKRLALSSNQIRDLSPLAGITSLKELRLGTNKINDISPLIGLAYLKNLDLKGNTLNEEAKNRIIPQLKKNGVDVEY